MSAFCFDLTLLSPRLISFLPVNWWLQIQVNPISSSTHVALLRHVSDWHKLYDRSPHSSPVHPGWHRQMNRPSSATHSPFNNTNNSWLVIFQVHERISTTQRWLNGEKSDIMLFFPIIKHKRQRRLILCKPHAVNCGRFCFWFLAPSVCVFVMVALWNRTDHYIFILSFVLSSFSFFPRLISAVRRLDVCHTCADGVALVRT